MHILVFDCGDICFVPSFWWDVYGSPCLDICYNHIYIYIYIHICACCGLRTCPTLCISLHTQFSLCTYIYIFTQAFAHTPVTHQHTHNQADQRTHRTCTCTAHHPPRTHGSHRLPRCCRRAATTYRSRNRHPARLNRTCHRTHKRTASRRSRSRGNGRTTQATRAAPHRTAHCSRPSGHTTSLHPPSTSMPRAQTRLL
jgi:hypothetical protein